MLVRPRSCQHGLALRRLQVSSRPSAAALCRRRPTPHSSSDPPLSSQPLRHPHHHHRLLSTLSDARPWRRKVFLTGVGFLPERTLATAFDYGAAPSGGASATSAAAAAHGGLDALDSFPSQRYPLMYPPPPLPSAGAPTSGAPSPKPGTPTARPLWELHPHNFATPLVLEEPAAPYARQKVGTNGVPGDVEEMLSVLDACLQVGKAERAALVLKRLGRLHLSTPTVASKTGGAVVGTSGLVAVDMTDLQNRYLRLVLEQLLAEPDTHRAEGLHKWYELEIRGRGVEQTPETIAYMLKASLMTARGARRERLVDRYMSMAPGQAGLEVLYMTGILNDQDRAAITAICRTYNLEPSSEEVAQFLGEASASESAGASFSSSASSSSPPPPSSSSPLPPSTLFEAALQSIISQADSPAPEVSPPATDAAQGPSETASSELPLGEAATSSASTAPSSPKVLETPQRGMGLRVLKQTLSLFSEIPEGRDIASLGLRERREIQARLERDCVEAAVERWREENVQLLKMGLNTSLSSGSLNGRLYEWHQQLEQRLQAELALVDQAEAADKKGTADLDRCLYGPFLRQSTTTRLAAVTIVSALSSLAIQGADRGVPMSHAITQIAKVAEEDIRLQRHEKEAAAQHLRRKKQKQREMQMQMQMQPTAGDARTPGAPGTTETLETSATAEQLKDEVMAWPLTIRVKVGAVLLSMLMETAKMTVIKEDENNGTLLSEQQPALSRVNRLRRGKKVGMLLANEALVEMMKKEPRGDFLARHLPMVVPPQPWTGFSKGGFLAYPVAMVRIKDGRSDQKMYVEAALRRGDMQQVLRGLDVLGRTAWRINRGVFDVMLESWNSGEALAAIPPLAPQIETPPEPDATDDPMKRRTWLQAVKAAENERSALHSMRCFMNFQMEIAQAFRDQTFYFPHNIDFRGRAYPVPPYFNHMGADHVRGLLTFAESRVLGARGLQWLKVHVANVFGYDKASLADREAFVMDKLDEVRDSAANPLGGRRWWLQAEDPWQCLAACMELAAAMALPDPTQFASRLPVHQDGTCNGLQHYAALGGDSWGARQVNLEPGAQPADVYSAVADMVKERMAEDAARGDPRALALDGRIKRKVVKQTVMTNVYGVTFAGARKQVLKQLDALYPSLAAETGQTPMVLASYIATHIFGALSTMFGGAHDIQRWLGELGSRVCRALTADQVAKVVDEVDGKQKKLLPETAEAAAGAETETPEKPAQKKRGRKKKNADLEAVAEAALEDLAADELDDVSALEADTEATETTEKAFPILRVKSKSDKSAKSAPSRARKSKEDAELVGMFRSTLVWTTPLQMPVVQPYRKSSSRAVRTCLQDLVLETPSGVDPVHTRKQLQGFPPNFIHSLDASHMLLSALECDAAGLCFAAVHDSFWTHAADVDTMNRVLRDAFVRIHSDDIIQRLASEFEVRYRGAMYMARLDPKSPAARQIKALRRRSTRGVRGTPAKSPLAGCSLKDELSLETKRLALLASDDPALVARGRAMVTAASVLAEHEAAAAAAASSLASSTSSSAPSEGDASTQSALLSEDVALLGSSTEDVDTTGDTVVSAEAAHGAEGTVSDTVGEAEATEEDDEDMALAGTGNFVAHLKNLKKKQKFQEPPVLVWMPLTLPPIPAKGDFDVTRLKDSEYFFS